MNLKRKCRSISAWLLLVMAVGVAVAGCDVFGEEDDDRGRIVLGRSVDGLPLGADTLSALRHFGRPSFIDRGPSFISYRYTVGDQAGVNLHFSVDRFREPTGRTVFALADPYGGTTEDGIGIGTNRQRVHDLIGAPDWSSEGNAGMIHDRYVVHDANAAFLYGEDEAVISITMSNDLEP